MHASLTLLCLGNPLGNEPVYKAICSCLAAFQSKSPEATVALLESNPYRCIEMNTETLKKALQMADQAWSSGSPVLGNSQYDTISQWLKLKNERPVLSIPKHWTWKVHNTFIKG